MDKQKFILGLSFIAGCIVLGLSAICATKTNKSYDRTVSVRGLSEREVKADNVIWPLAYRVGGDNLSELYAQSNRMNNKVVDFLKKAGIKESDITIGTPQISDNRATSYNSNATFNYLITSVVTVCSSDVDLILKVQTRVGELISAGIPIGTADSWDYRTSYSFNALNDIKPAMIEDATANAREAALKFAKDSKSRLGKIKTATQGQFSISDRDSNTPHIKNVRVVTSVTYYLND